jgi:hypothetical protein
MNASIRTKQLLLSHRKGTPDANSPSTMLLQKALALQQDNLATNQQAWRQDTGDICDYASACLHLSLTGFPLENSPRALNYASHGSPNPTGTVSLHLEATVVTGAQANVHHDGTHLAKHPSIQAATLGHTNTGMAGAAFGWMGFRWTSP